ncbi:MAG: hypothetical protein GC182_09070 [Rhodopseudomonas sp.]|nr:hypothetical protein [Rhodopseudomonas sp.]
MPAVLVTDDCETADDVREAAARVRARRAAESIIASRRVPAVSPKRPPPTPMPLITGKLVGRFGFPIWNVKVTVTLGPALRAYKIEEIKKAVSEVTEISLAAIDSPRRHRDIVTARHIVCLLCAHLIPSASYPMIGRKIGGRDHTTIMYAVKKNEWVFDEIARAVPGSSSALRWARAAVQTFKDRGIGNPARKGFAKQRPASLASARQSSGGAVLALPSPTGAEGGDV